MGMSAYTAYRGFGSDSRPAIVRARESMKEAVEKRYDVNTVTGAACYINAFEAGAASRDAEVSRLQERIKLLESDNRTYQQRAIDDARTVEAALMEMVAHGIEFATDWTDAGGAA
jgi:hypothetical protein